MIEVDGGAKSGSGTLLRISVALAAIRGEELRIYNIRKRRTPSGLRPQHLEAVLAAARLCGAEVRGAELGSREVWFRPHGIRGGEFEAEIGTAGSIPMLLMTVLPICLYAEGRVGLRVSRGGTDVRGAPTINYLRHLLLPTLRRMGAEASIAVRAYGYYPAGMGEVYLEAEPCPELRPIRLAEFGRVEEVHGLSVCTSLRERRVAERQAEAAERHLRAGGLDAEVDVVYDASNPLQKGSSIVLWAETDTGALLGGDAIGELRKPSEEVGREAAANLLREVEAGATADIHLADMLVPYIGLASEGSVYTAREATEHLDANLWLTEKILGGRLRLAREGRIYRVERG